MATLLGLWGTAAAAFGVVTFILALSPIHEIEAALSFLIATVAIGCAGIIEAVEKSKSLPVVLTAQNLNASESAQNENKNAPEMTAAHAKAAAIIEYNGNGGAHAHAR